MNIRDRIKELRRVKASELRPHPKNWRTHSEGQLDAIRGVLAEVGFAGAELAYELEDGTLQLIDGHARAEVAGDAEIPVLILDVNDDEANKILATFDPIGAMAGIDAIKLDAVLRDVQTGNEALGKMLADLADEAGLYRDDAPPVDEDDVPDVPEDPISQAGDLWILGEHRLLCGDATNPEALDRLMAGDQADLVITDPPYNVAYTGKTEEALQIKNDSMTDASFREFLVAAFHNACRVTKPGRPAYVFHADTEGVNFRSAFKEAGYLLKQCLIWVKNSMVLGRQDYQWQHEPILYGWKPGEAHRWYGEFDKTTVVDDDIDLKKLSKGELADLVNQYRNGEFTSVIRSSRPTRSIDHPTMKPVNLVSFMVRNSSQAGDVVLDLFGGSGSTMSACEQNKRKARLMELDPRYCDVIVKRYEKLTGQEARLDAGRDS